MYDTIKPIERVACDSEVLVIDDSERQSCEIWTRVMGYHRPMSSFNIGKQGEFHERKYFVQNKVQLHVA